MNFLALAQRVKRESGRSGGGPASVATATGEDLFIFDWVRDAWREIQMMPMNWAWMRKQSVGDLLINTVAHTPLQVGASGWERWVPESDGYKPTVFRTTDLNREWPLTYVRYERFRQQFQVGAHAAGAPQFWSISPTGEFLVGPKPDASNYDLRANYYALPQELTADGDVPNMPERFHMLIVWKALQQAGGFDAASEVWQRAEANASNMESLLITSQGEQIAITAHPLGRNTGRL